MNRRRKRKIVLVVILALLLAFLSLWYWNYRATRKIGFSFTPPDADILAPPQFLYSFSGPDSDRLSRPIGVLVDGSNVYVPDSRTSKIYQFNLEGRLIRSFGKDKLAVPLYIAEHPKTGELYVSDRRKRAIHVFTPEGKYVREFDPKLPKDELPEFDTKGVQWAPVALAFAPDGSLYVTEILNGHRLLAFDPSGKFRKSTGNVGIVLKATESPQVFQFPNGVSVQGDEVWVVDSNNRRIQVFSLDLEYKDLIATEGLPRGMAFLERFPGEGEDAKGKVVVIDTLAHDGTIWNVEGEKLLNFGQHGVLDGQFNYPTAIGIAEDNKLFITDSANARVQVWGWPEHLAPIPIPAPSLAWLWCLSPLLLLPLLLLLRKREFFATPDFVEGLVAAGALSAMPDSRRRWFVMPEDLEQLKDISEQGIDLGELLHPAEYSESDTFALMQRMELDHDTAARLSAGQRAFVFCTDDAELRRLAKMLGIDVVNHAEFLERFGSEPKGSDEEAA